MNTALEIFIDHKPSLQRIHFYDADIESFSETWISKAEDAADLDYDVVRHYFPRSSTDAQVTWQITRVGFNLLWPHSTLAWIQQPLGGELLMSRGAVEVFLNSDKVMGRSDWGIDTMYTFLAVKSGLSVCEIYVPQVSPILHIQYPHDIFPRSQEWVSGAYYYGKLEPLLILILPSAYRPPF